jgi:hypothetical protein
VKRRKGEGELLVKGGNNRFNLTSNGMDRVTTRGPSGLFFPSAGSAEELGGVVVNFTGPKKRMNPRG